MELDGGFWVGGRRNCEQGPVWRGGNGGPSVVATRDNIYVASGNRYMVINFYTSHADNSWNTNMTPVACTQ